MLNLFRRKAEVPSPEAEYDLILLRMLDETSSTMRELFSDPFPFTMLAGATFALHQDTFRAFAVDMRRTDDVVLAAALDKLQPHVLGPFPKRATATLDALISIDNTNLDFLQKGRPENMPQREWQIRAFMARLRSLAARIWLLTIQSKFKNRPAVTLGVSTIWMMLSHVKPEDLLADANEFSGTYYLGGKTQQMNLNHWCT